MHYYIVDCFGQIVGNKKGYRTFKGADIQANSKKSKVYRLIWDAYYKMKDIDPTNKLVNKIVQGKEFI